jgi:hypothetical protein
MNLFPFTEFHLLSSLPEAEIVKRLSPDKNKLGSWRFKKKNEFYVVHDFSFYSDASPHMWIQLNTTESCNIVVKICQKNSRLRLMFHLSVLILFFIPFMENSLGILRQNFIFEKDFPSILNFSKYFLFILIVNYTILLFSFLLKTTKNKKFIMGLLEAEPYTPPKQSTDNQKSDIIQ